MWTKKWGKRVTFRALSNWVNIVQLYSRFMWVIPDVPDAGNTELLCMSGRFIKYYEEYDLLLDIVFLMD